MIISRSGFASFSFIDSFSGDTVFQALNWYTGVQDSGVNGRFVSNVVNVHPTTESLASINQKILKALIPVGAVNLLPFMITLPKSGGGSVTIALDSIIEVTGVPGGTDSAILYSTPPFSVFLGYDQPIPVPVELLALISRLERIASTS